MLDFDLLFDEFPNTILPFDFDKYANVGKRFEIVTTNCKTGMPTYFEEYTNHSRLLTILRASSSMPLFSPIVDVDNIPMLDGGIADPIPIERALKQGYRKMVIVLTRNKEYRKKENTFRLPPFIYHKYPSIREALNKRSQIYNKALALVEELEKSGQAIVIRPTEKMTIERIEKDITKLEYFYNHGYNCTTKKLTNLI